MSEFIEVEATHNSLSRRKLVQGVGINDAWYITQQPNHKVKVCPYYQRWVSMLKRCYSLKFLKNNPTYGDCSVEESWRTFSNFRSWMEKQDWEGKHLDKDLLIYGNKTYSPATCLFVSNEVNRFLTDSLASRGDYSQGVVWHKKANKFQAQCRVRGVNKHLGYYLCESAAASAYCKCKARVITDLAYEEETAALPKLQEALFRHAKRFSDRVDKLQGELND